MEAAGLALGVAGLAGLFSTCLECYQLVQRGATMHKDAMILMTKFENQELRLTAWGRACGLFGPEEYDGRLDDPELSVRIGATLGCIKSLFQDEKDLNRRYGLRPGPPPANLNTVAATPRTGASSSESEGEAEALTLPTKWPLGSFFRSRRQRQRFSLLNKAHWAMAEWEKFAELIQHLKDFNDDLEAMTRATDVPRRQRIVVEYEIEEVDDVEVLEEMAMAASDDDGDVVSDTASIRLERIREGSIRTASIRTVSVRTATNTDSSASFVTARTSLSLSIDEVVMDFQYWDHMSSIENYSSQESRISTAQTLVGEHSSLDSSSSSDATSTRTQTRTPTATSDSGLPKIRRKCVALGDSDAHVTDLLTVFTLGYFPTQHTPTLFKNYVTDCRIDGRNVELALWDLSGQQEYPQLRKASYDKTDVILIGYDPHQPMEMIAQGIERWADEVAASCPGALIVVVGIIAPDINEVLELSTKLNKTADRRIRSAAEQSGGRVVGHLLCNVHTGERVDDVFELATRAAVTGGRGGLTIRPPGAPRKRSALSGLFSGLRRIKEEDGDDR